ncbi:MAG: tetratricopeptide repeat protein [Alteraurantiacibacter sp.]
MTSDSPEIRSTIKEYVMRFGPAAVALSLLAAVTASAGIGATRQPDARAEMLVAEGRAALEAGNADAATDAFEAALVIDPAYSAVYLELGRAARLSGMQGKAIHYYREVLERDPDNLAALEGEGEALAEKGAMAGARENLARLEELCSATCTQVASLTAAIDRGPLPRVMTAEVAPDTGVSVN